MGDLSHFRNSKHQVIEQDVAVTPLKMYIPFTHTKSNLDRFVSLSARRWPLNGEILVMCLFKLDKV